MPFLHWFKKKSENAKIEAETALEDKPPMEPTSIPETFGTNLEQASGQTTLQDGPRSTDRAVPSPDAAGVSATASGEIDVLQTTPHLSVPIGAFYARLPAHLLVSKAPDLAQLVQIAEEDAMLDQEAQEATVPLSILSLSCPEIFLRAVDGADDVP